MQLGPEEEFIFSEQGLEKHRFTSKIPTFPSISYIFLYITL